ncbi:unnamed protein product [Rotaria socialis]|uniref:SWIM-type domain-containing protein n=8 Tax=Rotaria TaxID=231623 RepID=A0A818JY64_9BILA|nr:unnamed protein product [Rotaria socialis]CAF4852346.1 unnamed protein product [Rotaria socialis]
MPHTNPTKCVACDRSIRSSRVRFLNTNFLRVFVSIEQCKRVTSSNAICDGCRSKYYRWKKLTMGDFDQFDTNDPDYLEPDDEVDENNDMVIDVSPSTSIDEEDGQIDPMEKKATTISFPVYRCSKSHGYCIVCKTNNSESKCVLTKEQRTMVFLKRGILVPENTRCCSVHMYKRELTYEALEMIQPSKLDDLILNGDDVKNLMIDFRLTINSSKTFDFDNPSSLDDDTYKTITGLSRDNFHDVLGHLTTMNNSNVRSVRVALAVFLTKLRLGFSNRVLACLFHLKSKRTVSRIFHQVREALMKYFVPLNLGFQHITRDVVLNYHQTVIATELLTNEPDQVVLIADGTYLYCQKSSNNEFQRRTYSNHKHRHLIKPMIITASNGYILSVLGPFFANSSNNDAAILKHCLLNNEQQILNWLRDDDILVLDRGFRDVVNTLSRLRLQVAMPGFLHNQKQFSPDEANRTRFVTKTRWVVESVNGKIKNWKFFAQTLQNTSLPFAGNCLDIVCALINKYYCPAIANIQDGQEIAAQMREMWKAENALEQHLRELDQGETLRWSKYNAAMCLFPSLTEDDVRNLTFGSYQIKMAKSYIVDHLQQSDINEEQLEFVVELCGEHDDLVRARFQSRHSNRKKYIATVRFNEKNEQPITGWFCTCSVGGREVGMCSHITALLWHIGVERAMVPTSTHPLSASKLLTAIDDSMKFSDDEYNSDNDINDLRGTIGTANATNDTELDW